MIKPPRLVSLDVFRGMTILLMIVVNTPGAGAVPWPQLLHAEWHGLTLTDLVFPSFLFAVGNSIPFATMKWIGLSRRARFLKILKRALLIFTVGYLLNWYTSMHWSEAGGLSFTPIYRLRIMGVLQRIGLCYFIGALLSEYFSTRALAWIAGISLLSYWVFLNVFGGWPDPYSVNDNAVLRLDLHVFGEPRLYREHGILFDPEGLLSTIPSAANVIAGIIAGRWLQRNKPVFEMTCTMLAAGCVVLLLGVCWSCTLPLNKKLWTSSFALVTIGIASLVMGLLLYLHRILESKAAIFFFSVFGRNPLFIYILSNLLLFVFILPVGDTDLQSWVNMHFFQRIFPGPAGSFIFSLIFGLSCWVVGWLLDRKKIYIRL